jgi:hypothetical protein
MKFIIIRSINYLIVIFLFILNTNTLYVGEVKTAYDINEHRLRYLVNDCNNLICPSPGGICSPEGKCVCSVGYITVPSPSEHKFCNYAQKKQSIAFMLEMFGLIGFGFIYIGYYFRGLMKIFVFFLIIVYGTQFIIVFLREKSDTQAVYFFKLALSCCCVCFPIVWHFIDLVNFAFNIYNDNNGIPLLSW